LYNGTEDIFEPYYTRIDVVVNGVYSPLTLSPAFAEAASRRQALGARGFTEAIKR